MSVGGYNLDIEIALKKYESAVNTYNLLFTLFDFLITFFVLHIIFSLFNMSVIFSMISAFEPYTGIEYHFLGFTFVFETLGTVIVEYLFATIITLILYKKKTRKDTIKLIEEKFPVLKDKLGTAYENRHTDNIIVNDLVNNVVATLKSVDSRSLLNIQLLKLFIVLTIVTGFSAVYMATSDYHTGISPESVAGIIIPSNSNSNDTTYPVVENGGTTNNISDNTNSSLYGPPQVIVVQGKPVDLTIPPGTGAGFTNQQDTNQTNQTFIQSTPVDPSAVAAQSYYENLPEGYQGIIKSYFEQLDDNSTS